MGRYGGNLNANLLKMMHDNLNYATNLSYQQKLNYQRFFKYRKKIHQKQIQISVIKRDLT